VDSFSFFQLSAKASCSALVWTSAGEDDVRLPRSLRLDGASAECARLAHRKGQQKPKKLAKKAPQKSLKEQRAAKAAKKKSRD
jgi:hypothetical protein